MKFLLLVLLSLQAKAASTVADSIFDRIHSKTEVFVTSADGKSLRAIDGGWSEGQLVDDAKRAGSIAIAQNGNLPKIYVETKMFQNLNKQISVEMVQWGKMNAGIGKEARFTHELKKESFVIENFGSVQMSIPGSITEKYVVRVTPIIDRDSRPQSFNYLPMSLSDVLVTDSSGKVWGQGVSADGPVVRVSGPYGSVYVSFAPFPGATQMGFARGNDLELKIGEQKKLRFRSAKPVLGANYAAVVFARVELAIKLKLGGGGEMPPDKVERDILEFNESH